MVKKTSKKVRPVKMDELIHQGETVVANIRFASVDEPVKTIVVTSTDVDEGKSVSSLAIAMAMAKAGKRTLIMDCDMRRRSLAKYLNLHSSCGLYAVLSGESTIKQAIMRTDTENLFFLDCEPKVASPADILSTKRFTALLCTLRDIFDYVVIDTPPLSLFVDAAVAAAKADGTILIVRQRRAKRRMVADALAQLKSANARVLGTVLTFAQKGDSDYGYYYKYYEGESKRVSKKSGASEQVQDIKREFDDSNLDAWANSVGARSSTNRSGAHVRGNVGDFLSEEPVDDSYAAGAFKND